MIISAAEPGRDKTRFIPPLLVLSALFLIYPNRTILCAPDWIIFAFSTASISLLCAGAVFFVPERIRDFYRALPRWFRYAFLFFVLIAALHAIKNSGIYSLGEVARSFAYLTIPLFACLYRDELKKLLPWALALLWFLTVAHSFVEHIMNRTDVLAGLPMNRNWNATLILISAPFAVFVTFRRADSILKRFLLLLAIVLPSVYVFVVCDSLAAFLALPGALFLFLLMNRRFRKIFLIASAALLIIAVSGFLLLKTYCPGVQNFLEKSDRIAFYTATVRMIADAPVTGFGIPSFEQEFLPYLRTPHYFLCAHATDRVSHPHNHLLFMAAGMGLAGLAAWLALWLVPVLLHTFRRDPDPEEPMLDKLILFAWFALALHGMVDLVLYQEPTNILALLFTGWIWAKVFPVIKKEAAAAEDPTHFARYSSRFFCYFLTGLALLMAACNLFSAVHFRLSHRKWLSGQKQEAQKHIRLMHLTAHWDNTNFYLYQSAMRLPPDEALAMLNQITAGSTPDLAHINLLRGRQLMLLNQPDAAKEALFRDASLYPLHVEALYDLWMIALFEAKPNVANLLAGEINYRLEQRGLDARILTPFPAPQDARISGPDAQKAMTYETKK